MEHMSRNDEITVTVVVPSLNVAPYIHQCMDSVLNQTLRDIEVFVVDAASTDGTHEILEEYQKKDPRVFLYDDIKRSTGYAKNIGIDQGRGKYYAIVESDDYIELDMLENMVHIAEETGADIVKGNYNNFVGMGEERRDFYSTVSPYPDDYEKLTDPKMDNHCFTWGMSEWLGIYRMDFLREYNIRHNETKGAAFQDTGFWFLSFAYANKIYLTNRYYYNYRRDNPYSSMRSSGNVYGICIEYDYIKGCIGEDEDTMKRVYSAWYRGFFYDNCVACNRLNDTNRHELIGRMRKTMLEGDAEGKIDRRLYSADEWDDLQLLLKSGDEFLKKKYPDKNIQEENRKILINVIKAHEETVIFGAGWYGCNLQFLLENLNIKIAAFADNDAKKWGSRRNSLEILSLEECERRFRDAIYLIANKDHSSDIYNGLLEKGISTERIKICRLETLTDSIV